MKTNVRNMTSNRGNSIPNQFIIETETGTFFQSYGSMIAHIPATGKIQLDEKYWNYSKTTGKYRNMFLGETGKETQKKIDNGEYELTNLN